MKQQSTNGQQQDTTQTITNDQTNFNSSNNELITETVQIPDTPFTAVKVVNRWFIALGKYRLTEPIFETREQAINDATNNVSWERLINIISIVSQSTFKTLNNK